MAVYMIIEVSDVKDKDKYSEYIRKVPQTIEKFEGKYLARGGQVSLVSGNWKPQRLIIVEFASMDKFRAWWNSPEYRLIAPLREQSAQTNAILVNGVKVPI